MYCSLETFLVTTTSAGSFFFSVLGPAILAASLSSLSFSKEKKKKVGDCFPLFTFSSRTWLWGIFLSLCLGKCSFSSFPCFCLHALIAKPFFPSGSLLSNKISYCPGFCPSCLYQLPPYQLPYQLPL